MLHCVNDQILIDPEDAWLLEKYRYSKQPEKKGRKTYPERFGDGESFSLHHDVAGKPPAGMVIDHKDGNVFNVRRGNLRAVTHTVNGMNKACSPRGYCSDGRGSSLFR